MTSQPSSVRGTDSRAWIAPGLALLVLVSLVAAVVAVAALTRDESLPPQPAGWELPEPAEPVHSFAVVRASGGTLVLASGADAAADDVEVHLAPTDPVDFLEPADAGEVAPDDWITVIGIRNEVRTFAIRMVIMFPGGGSPGADGWVRTPAGFVGHEAARESREGPIVAGPVTEIRDGEVVLDAGDEVLLRLNPGGPLRTIRSGSPAEIRDGDRVALRPGTDGDLDPSLGVLVLVGGAR